MDSHPSQPGCKEDIRPPPCPVCGGPSWWNGWRLVAQMVLGVLGTLLRLDEVPRHRARCLDPGCPGGGWTLYEPQGYPCRTFTPAVAAAALLELAAAPAATLASVAAHWGCAPRTVGRWQVWVGTLVAAAPLIRLCSRLDPEGFPPPQPDGIPLAGFLVLLLEHLARLLRDQGVLLEPGPGLGAILRQQFDRFRVVSFLTCASPPLQMVGATPWV